MAVKVGWRSYKTKSGTVYSGCKISGGAKIPKPVPTSHMGRAYYLTAMLEAPSYGSVQSYDRCGMSGGPMHNIAVYPGNLAQGSMFPLLRALELGAWGSKSVQVLWDAYKAVGWYVARDGKLKDILTGKRITGKAIRDEFSPVGGKVPKSGPRWLQARKWAVLHHNVFADPATFKAQQDFAIGYLLKGQKKHEDVFYTDQGMDPETLRVWTEQDETDLSEFEIPTDIYNNHLSLKEDLAMCMYHSHSVNAPGPARTALVRVLKRRKRGDEFAKLLIWTLATYKYGNWKVRYARTRKWAMASKLWPAFFFTGSNAIMPRSVPSKRPV
jgi:hypothetical protein